MQTTQSPFSAPKPSAYTNVIQLCQPFEKLCIYLQDSKYDNYEVIYHGLQTNEVCRIAINHSQFLILSLMVYIRRFKTPHQKTLKNHALSF